MDCEGVDAVDQVRYLISAHFAVAGAPACMLCQVHRYAACQSVIEGKHLQLFCSNAQMLALQYLACCFGCGAQQRICELLTPMKATGLNHNSQPAMHCLSIAGPAAQCTDFLAGRAALQHLRVQPGWRH